MLLFGLGLSDRHAEDEAAVELGVSQIYLAALVQLVHELLVDVVAAAMAKADEIERDWGHELEPLVCFHPRDELLRQLDVAADVVAQTFDPVMADDKPQLERAESTTERDLPITVIDDGS